MASPAGHTVLSPPDRNDADRPPLPDDIIHRIATILSEDADEHTIACLQKLSKSSYHAVTPVLYNHLKVNGHSWGLLSMRPDPIADSAQSSGETEHAGSCFGSKAATVRRLDALRHVKRLAIDDIPPDFAVQLFLEAQTQSDQPFMPRLRSISLQPKAVKYLRTWSSGGYTTSRMPPLLEALAKACKPTSLCLTFPLVESSQWEEHRETSVGGQYQLVSRLNKLKEEEWSCLETLEVHDIVFQVLPSLRGCRNIYHFSNHVVRDPLRPARGYAFPGGADAVGLPGLSWNIRAWQVGQAIKNVFPSGVDAKAALASTSWDFINVEGHILTKRTRDDDDESGVGWDEAGRLVRSAVQVGLPIDLPARDGFSAEDIVAVFERLSYPSQTPTPSQCSVCGRESRRLDHRTPD